MDQHTHYMCWDRRFLKNNSSKNNVFISIVFLQFLWIIEYELCDFSSLG
jgi:hypothetical protein